MRRLPSHQHVLIWLSRIGGLKIPNTLRADAKLMDETQALCDSEFLFRRIAPTLSLHMKTKSGHKPTEISCSPVDRV